MMFQMTISAGIGCDGSKVMGSGSVWVLLSFSVITDDDAPANVTERCFLALGLGSSVSVIDTGEFAVAGSGGGFSWNIKSKPEQVCRGRRPLDLDMFISQALQCVSIFVEEIEITRDVIEPNQSEGIELKVIGKYSLTVLHFGLFRVVGIYFKLTFNSLFVGTKHVICGNSHCVYDDCESV